MLKLVFYVPETHLEKVKQAVFLAGAGHWGNYDSCCWQTLGTGQFRPIEGAEPFLGSVGSVEKVAEWRVEMICDETVVQTVVSALCNAHPYEEVAFDLTRLLDLDAQ